ncbi:MAG: DNA topoisomerase I [Candidatus Micrarchaeota archaeon]|nr:DNA topoisomerase I [Candidatus Micrarchaeota archaeon]
MQLIISEKPKVAQKIAQSLTTLEINKKKGYGQAYYFEIERKGKKILVVPAVGHLYTLDEKEKSTIYPTFDIEWKEIYLVTKEGKYTKDYIKTIEELAKKASEVIIACDYDIEGSLIGYNVLRFAIRKKDGKRMKFSSLTKEELIQAYENRMELDIENALAGETRHILDWFYGINLSRALMSAIKSSGRFQIMSIGRVQGPTLNILGQKEIEIKNFKPTPYWEVSCIVKKVRFLHINKRFEKKEEALKVLEDSKNPPHIIEKIEKREFKENPPTPFDLTSLQLEAYRAFRFSPQQTQQIAQNLYENSLISYPRTSSQKLPSKLGLNKIIEKIGEQVQYSKYCQKIIENRWFKPHEGKKEDPAHPAIYPTGLKAEGISKNEQKLYDLIVRRFLACFMPAAVKENTKVILSCSSQKYFAEGTKIVLEGWQEVYGQYLEKEENNMNLFVENEKVKIEKFSLEEKMTKPPRRYSVASIVAELEKRSLGTKATRATIVETLFKRGYVKGKNSIVVTSFGLSVLEILKKYAPEILDEELTRSIEQKMEQIQEKKIEPQQVIEEGKNILIKILEKFKKKEREVGTQLTVGLDNAIKENSILGKCKSCGGELKILKFGKKQFVGCSNYPNCKQTYPLPAGAEIENLNKTCPECNTPMIRVRRRGKKTFEMCLEPTCKTKKDWTNNNTNH